MSTDTVAHPGPATQDAQQLLRGDRARIERALGDCRRMVDGQEQAGGDGREGGGAEPAGFSPADLSGLLARLGALLGAHLRMKRELLYPGLGAPVSQVADLLSQHEALLGLLAGLASPDMEPSAFGTALSQLASAIDEHLDDESNRLFQAPSSIDLAALGTAMAIRRGELLGHQGVD